MNRLRATLLIALASASLARGDEGMWLLNDFPSAKVQAVYGFGPSQQWLDSVRLGAVRLANGCSASFVSTHGLVMTNHHCVRDCVQDLSTSRNDYLERGFFAAAQKDERRCANIEANQLVSITDVTDRIRSATAGKEGEAFATALRQESARIEGACATGPKVRCDVVNLFHGGRYHLYTYRRFQDVRLAFAPEFPMAAFGGYADNFEFPRYGFDVGFLRIYENDAPVDTPEALPWAASPAREGDLVFAAGNPGGTERVQTTEQLALQRDLVLPWLLVQLAQLRGTLLQFSGGNRELFRISRAHIRTVENALKALGGRRAWLADPGNFERKRAEDAELRNVVRKDPAKETRFGPAWPGIAQAVQAERELFVRHALGESKAGLPSDLFEYARLLVRAAEERPKPSPERLREYGDARLPTLQTRLLRRVPVPRSLERVLVTFGLRNLRDTLGPDDPLVQAAIGKRSPEDVAREAVEGTRLDDPRVREVLWKGGAAAVAASKDPMIALARRLDPQARAIRREYENRVEGALARNGELLFQAAVAVRGTSSYPDATFTLRLSYGTIAGWAESGKQIPAITRLSGLYDRNTGQFPFAVAPTWLGARPKLDPEMPFDIATTNDIIGGNSGSPLINRNGEVVALIFDGNRASLGGDYGYDAATNRAVALHGQAILEGLEQVYGAGRLVKEIRTR
ncbi:MAG TPA: S46 family peptidase [Myxococcaceae bacterium]|nr:S46 family peptidase [Myxococcaceae bacterium]